MDEFKNLGQLAGLGGGELEFAFIVSAAQAAANWHAGLQSGPTAEQRHQLCRGHDDGPTSLLGDNWWGHLDRD
ncbi:hypothetical protein [Arthrobacter sp. HY1533]|uniref:hypothetical protein n=1 Tax=Arthrobacter sp. HY1533 TaxID=2970919 RepID=UPI0022B9D885|nr:hypothetical protein [Arthrobacter sp. HY1533]